MKLQALRCPIIDPSGSAAVVTCGGVDDGQPAKDQESQPESAADACPAGRRRPSQRMDLDRSELEAILEQAKTTP